MMWGYWGGGGPGGGSWGWGLISMIFMMIFWVAAIGIGILMLRRVMMGNGGRWNGGREGGADSEDAISILKKRYARGEISREEFEEMRKNLL